MKVKNTIEQILGELVRFERYEKGLTNHNYYAETKNQAYIVRVPRADNEQVVSRSHETAALRAIQNLDFDVPTIYYDEKSGIKITEFIPDCQEYEPCTAQDKIEQVGRLLRKFHQADLHCPYAFDPYERYLQYKAHVQKPIYDLTCYEARMREIASQNQHQVLCHNDLVSGNLLFSKDRLYLIDYEYAAMNDPLFDVISFLSENQIFDEELRQRFYLAYFNAAPDILLLNQLKEWEIFEDVLWCTWAMMMAESRLEQVYLDIAKDKYQALRALVANKS
ncbi:MAG TPA: phosphotransferase [Dielma fastidiosa]|nr:phosphotransferase [Dielma fastidiosa]